MIDFKIGEHGRLYLLKHQKKFGVGDFDNYRDIEDFVWGSALGSVVSLLMDPYTS